MKFVFTEAYITSPPRVHAIPDFPAIIGVNSTRERCLEGNLAGTNGKNLWTVNGTAVNVTDFSNLTNSSSPLCDTCACYDKYLMIGEVRRKVDEQLRRTGFAAFIVTMFSFDDLPLDSPHIKARLCHGVTNRFFSVLVTTDMVHLEEGTTDVSFTVTSAMDIQATKNFSFSSSKSLLVGS